jgi:hypothetical protein
LGLAIGIAAFLTTRTYYRSGLEEKLTTKYKGLYEAEVADNARRVREATEARTERDEAYKAKELAEAEKSDILGEYTQLTQLFAKKSVILENITGIYSKIAETLQSGDPERMRAFLRFLATSKVEEAEGIHKTNPGG